MSETQEEGIANLRKALEGAQAQVKELSAERDSYREQVRTFQAAGVFREVGLSDKHAELYLKAQPDAEITVDSVKEFAQTYGLQASTDAAGDSTPAGAAAPPPDSGLKSFSDAGSAAFAAAAGAASPSKISFDSFQQMLATNKDQALRLYAEGRVDRPDGNVQHDALVASGVVQR